MRSEILCKIGVLVLFTLALAMAIYTIVGIDNQECSLQRIFGNGLEFYSLGTNVTGIVLLLIIIMVSAIIYLLRKKPFLAKIVTIIIDTALVLLWLFLAIIIIYVMPIDCIGLAISYLIYAITLLVATIVINVINQS